MQIILVSPHLKTARTLTIMPRNVLAVLAIFAALVVSTAVLVAWLSVYWRLPVVQELMVSLHLEETRKTREYLGHNLEMMASRIGALQARLIQLDALGERLASGAGVRLPVAAETARRGQGGAFLPSPLDADGLAKALDRLALAVERQTDRFQVIEAHQMAEKVKARRLPTALPVAQAALGSPFGTRTDPIAGVRSLHEGIDFNAEVGTPVRVAADGVVLSAAFHPEFGNLVEVDHGEGLLTRYAHLSQMAVQPGALVRRGMEIGAVGNTGRSTGPHLHFEVRQGGVAQNPAVFLKQGAEYAQLKRR